MCRWCGNSDAVYHATGVRVRDYAVTLDKLMADFGWSQYGIREPAPIAGPGYLFGGAVVDAVCLDGRTHDYPLRPEVRFVLIHDATSVTGMAWC